MTDKAKTLDSKVLDLAKTITDNSTLALEGDRVTSSIDKSVYLDSLKAHDLDPEVAKKFRDHDAAFMAAATHSFGERAQDIQKKKGTPDRIVVRIPTISRDKLSLTFDRSRTSRNPKTKETIESYGVSAKWVQATGNQYPIAKDNLRKRALDLKIA